MKINQLRTEEALYSRREKVEKHPSKLRRCGWRKRMQSKKVIVMRNKAHHSHASGGDSGGRGLKTASKWRWWWQQIGSNLNDKHVKVVHQWSGNRVGQIKQTAQRKANVEQVDKSKQPNETWIGCANANLIRCCCLTQPNTKCTHFQSMKVELNTSFRQTKFMGQPYDDWC